MPRAFGCDEQGIDAGGRLDLTEVHVEAVRAHENVAGLQVRLDAGAIDVGLHFIRQEHVDEVALLRSVFDAHRFEAVTLGEIVVRAAGPLADDHVAAAIAKVLRLGVALRAVTENSDRLAFEQRKVGVVVVVDRGGHGSEWWVVGGEWREEEILSRTQRLIADRWPLSSSWRRWADDRFCRRFAVARA
jgi:hypothetical protein